ncbi:M23 family metallopeptidase [Desertivirga brevis]|uniref:M23 family metallopeptidase n=1 Tax=Desertivirga brevis TaxID=2810310 RepID=UPI001A95F5FA|nr:M23 family metallopeptidase [Pedobacter sp. SYSU D00873]
MKLMQGLVMAISWAVSATAQEMPLALPLESLRVTSPFGYRTHPLLKGSQFHKGIDLAARQEPVRAVMVGVVFETGIHPTLGNYIVIDHGGIRSQYGHLRKIIVEPGRIVTAGEVIGITGHSGRVTGEHLHFALFYNHQPIDPLLFLGKLIGYITSR